MKLYLVVLLQLSIAVYGQIDETTESPHHVSFHGYLRSGLGGSSNSGQMVDIVAPNNLHKFRLGNEANHYSELQLGYKYQEKNTPQSYEIVYMMSKYVPYGEKLDTSFPNTVQLYAQMNNVYKNTKIWVGKKYYDRWNIDMLDYFWLNSAQNSNVGAGIEDIKLSDKKDGKLNIALIQFRDEKGTEDTEQKKLSYYTFDVRLKELKVNDQWKFNLLGQVAYRPDNNTVHLTPKFGFGLGGWIDYKKDLITHTTSLILRKGPQMVMNGYTGESLVDLNNRLYDFNKAFDVILTNSFIYDDKKKHAIQGILTYSNKNYGIGNVNKDNEILDDKRSLNWLSLGFKYIHYINKHFNIVVEGGNDYVKNDKKNIEGSLQKITLAPQLSWDYGFYSRPVIRAFATYAHWSNSFKGITAVSDYNDFYKDKNNAFTYGLQLEVWW